MSGKPQRGNGIRQDDRDLIVSFGKQETAWPKRQSRLVRIEFRFNLYKKLFQRI